MVVADDSTTTASFEKSSFGRFAEAGCADLLGEVCPTLLTDKIALRINNNISKERHSEVRGAIIRNAIIHASSRSINYDLLGGPMALGSRRGGKSTTKSVRTAAWDTKPRESLLKRAQLASTRLSQRQGTQNAVPCASRSPSRLKPEREQRRFVGFFRDREQGAGHCQTLPFSARHHPFGGRSSKIRLLNASSNASESSPL